MAKLAYYLGEVTMKFTEEELEALLEATAFYNQNSASWDQNEAVDKVHAKVLEELKRLGRQ